MTQKVDNVVVFGAGAIGTLLGAYLQIGKKVNVHLVGRDPHMATIRENGLRVQFPNEQEITIHLKTYTDVKQLATKPDWIVLTVRTYQTRESMKQIVENFGNYTPVVTFQNGFAVKDIQDFIGDNAIGGETLISSRVMAPGFVKQPQNTGLYIGEMNGNISDRVKRMCASFDAVRSVNDCMEAVSTDNIVGAIWAKLLVNATNNTLSAVTDLTVRELYETEATQAYGYGLVKEILKVAEREGVEIYKTPVSLAKAFIDNSTSLDSWKAYLLSRVPNLAHFKLSMSDMLERGIRTEVDHINGYVVERANSHGLHVPHHKALVEVIHQIERRELRQGVKSLPSISSISD